VQLDRFGNGVNVRCQFLLISEIDAVQSWPKITRPSLTRGFNNLGGRISTLAFENVSLSKLYHIRESRDFILSMF